MNWKNAEKMLEEQIEEENFKCPQLTREQLTFWFERMAKYDITKKEHRQRLIDTFINAVFLYDDRILITFNHQNGQKTISVEEANGSDFKNGLRPYCGDKKDASGEKSDYIGFFAVQTAIFLCT